MYHIVEFRFSYFSIMDIKCCYKFIGSKHAKVLLHGSFVKRTLIIN